MAPRRLKHSKLSEPWLCLAVCQLSGKYARDVSVAVCSCLQLSASCLVQLSASCLSAVCQLSSCLLLSGPAVCQAMQAVMQVHCPCRCSDALSEDAPVREDRRSAEMAHWRCGEVRAHPRAVTRPQGDKRSINLRGAFPEAKDGRLV